MDPSPIVVGDYRLEERVHQAPGREVWRVTRQADSCSAFLKRPTGRRPALLELARLRHEHRRLNELDLPCVVRPLELIQDSQGLCLAVEDFGGRALAAELAGGAMALDSFFEVALALVEAVAAVHAAGLVHRDLNPSNMVIHPATGQLKLIDFELAEPVAAAAEAGTHVVGSLQWISPEQTGRLRRTIDERSDLYAVGATLYALLTGHPPFVTESASELVHAHLARTPVAPDVPEPLPGIVLRLLAKEPDDRYQSARGLLADLKHCAELHAEGRLRPFELGREDKPRSLRLPQRLYGREESLGLLRAALRRSCMSRLAFVRIAGWSGVGKTALVEAAQREVLASRGRCATGKYDQYRRTEPYLGLLSALRQVLSEAVASGDSPALTARVKKALSPRASVLFGDIPELELLLPDEPQVEAVRPTEARHRYERTLVDLVSALGSPQEPLLLFLDDLQWADSASLHVLEALFGSDSGAPGVLVVGAWRENEVDAAHPLRAALGRIEALHGDVVDLELGPLRVRDVRALLEDTLGRRSPELEGLAQALHRGSEGNPFCLRELLSALYAEGKIQLEAGAWSWDLEAIASRPPAQGVGALIAARLQQLSAPATSVLQVAACLGPRVPLRSLSAASELPTPQLVEALGEASRAGLVLLEGAGWKLLRTADPLESPPLDDAVLRFVHDAVQTAAYERTPESERPDLHLRVARLLVPQLDEQPESLLAVVEHYDRAGSRIQDPRERRTVAELHARAGARALTSTAFETARLLFEGGLDLLEGQPAWDEAPDTAWSLTAGACRTATLTGAFDAAGERLEQLRSRADGPAKQVEVFSLDMALAHHSGNLGAVVDIGLLALKALQAPIDRFPSEATIAAGFGALHEALQEQPLDGAGSWPWCEDPHEHGVQQLMHAVAPCAYLTQQSALWQHLALTLALRGLKHGPTPATSYGFSSLAMIVGGGLGQHEQARQLGDAAVSLADESGLKAVQGMTRFMVGGFVVHWTRPFSEAVAVVDQGYDDALNAGDTIYAAWCLASGAITTSLAGHSLAEAVERAERMASFSERHGLADNVMFLDPLRQYARALSGATDHLGTMNDGSFSERDFVRSMEDRFFRVPLHVFHVLLARLRLLAGDLEGASQALEEADQNSSTSFSMPILAEHSFVGALVQAARCTAAEGPDWEALESSRAVLASQAAAGPLPYRGRLLLVDAERARVQGDLGRALSLYEQAMDEAQLRGVHALAAEVAERAAGCLDAASAPRAARTWRLDAAHAWLRFGATGRAAALGLESGGEAPGGSPADSGSNDKRAVASSHLDIETALRAARSLASELDLDALLQRLSQLAMQSAGAEVVWLLLRGPRGLRLASRGESSGHFTRLDGSSDDGPSPSPSLVRLLAASREPVLCEDAQTDPRFAAAADLQDREVRSMLGLPLLHKSQLVGALVLENNLATGVFTAERLELLRMLSAQIAVALENAALVEDLRDLNVAYARFVPQQFLRFLGKEQITELSLGDAIERDMTVMFCDIRGFTARSEGQLPEENFRFINRYLSHIGPTIRKHGGFIDKYIGDGVMALFPGSSEAAVRAATAMGRALRDFNRELEADGEPAVDIGIGLHRGRLMLGTIGEAERMESTVISDAVNTAARVESLTRRFGCSCLLTEAVVDALPGRDSFLTRYLGRVLVKGRRDAVAVFELFQGDRRELREQKWSRRADFEGAVRAREDGASEAARTALEALVQAVPEDAVAARLLAELAP